MGKQLTANDILPMTDYANIRSQRRQLMVARKRNRRVAVGPHATFHFENYETMWSQVHEMLFIEKGGADQVDDELAAYNPLIPKGAELVATVMFEIDDPVARARILAGLGGVEETFWMEVNGQRINAQAETDLDRTDESGKASSVQFVHFQFTTAQIAQFRTAGAKVVLGVGHAAYPHMTLLSDAVRAELAGDFD